MISVNDKTKCCGCSACAQRCPKQCIVLIEDSEGFLYPKIDASKCIECNLCEKVCPLINIHNKIQPIDVLAVKNCNESERIESSSGGIFLAIARDVIKKGGVVFGVVFDSKLNVVHTYTENFEGIIPMLGSKYVQSRIGNCYKDAEKFLKSGREVLFTGTPCQIAGLHDFLRKEYSNLISVDILCHGVPSPKVWRKYIYEKLYSLNVDSKGTNNFSNSVSKVTDIQFRNKKSRGWKNYSFMIYYKDKGNKYNSDTCILSEAHDENTFMKGFLANVYLRPSCHDCKCKNGINHSDLTLADFWGIDLVMPNFDDDKGVSLVLVNSDRGKSLLYSCDVDIHKSSLVIAKRMNGGFKEKSIPNSKRKRFFSKIDDCSSIIDLIEDCSKPTLRCKIINKVKYINNKIMKIIQKLFIIFQFNNVLKEIK